MHIVLVKCTVCNYGRSTRTPGAYLADGKALRYEAECKLKSTLGLESRVGTHLKPHVSRHWPLAGTVHDFPRRGQSALPGNDDNITGLAHQTEGRNNGASTECVHPYGCGFLRFVSFHNEFS